MGRHFSPILPTTWASDISAGPWFPQELRVTGKLPLLESDLQPSRDVFGRYLSSVKLEFGQKGTGRPSPHISFANAVNDELLIKFVNEFGPVAAKVVVEVESTHPGGMSLEDLDKFDFRPSIGAIQDLAALRREQRTFASALKLLAELRRGGNTASIAVIQQQISDIADGVSYWPEQWEAERQWRASHNSAPVAWHFDSSRRDYILLLKSHASHPKPPRHDFASVMITPPYHAGHLVLCALFNAFDTKLENVGDGAVEALPFDSLRFGIRPALYQILKHVYLGHVGIQVCGDDRCRRLFESTRGGQVYCSTKCSERYRQRQQWVKSGSEQRKRRHAKKSSVKRKNTTH